MMRPSDQDMEAGILFIDTVQRISCSLRTCQGMHVTALTTSLPHMLSVLAQCVSFRMLTFIL